MPPGKNAMKRYIFIMLFFHFSPAVLFFEASPFSSADATGSPAAPAGTMAYLVLPGKKYRLEKTVIFNTVFFRASVQSGHACLHWR